MVAYKTKKSNKFQHLFGVLELDESSIMKGSIDYEYESERNQKHNFEINEKYETEWKSPAQTTD